MTYSVAGIPLNNPTFGWVFRAPSKPISELVRERTNVRTPSGDGMVAGMPATISPVTLSLVVRTPRQHLQTLVALFAAEGALTLTADTSRSATFELLSWTTEGSGPSESWLDVKFLIRLPQAFWRDALVTTSAATALDSASVSVAGLFPGMSAPVQDAFVRVKGAASGLQVSDLASMAWFTYDGALTSTQYLRFDSATGRAYVTSTNTWSGGTEVSGDIDFGGPRGVFEITPRLSPTNPSTRDGRLVVTTATRSAATVEVRGRGAYLI
ncbi:hypothetical protein [Microbacterium sp. NPDC058389]|uniref:hypothetical protein n=1 Tax=Microbacterium sp. NPDC058389 TaxID=3346475 RepID=UPI00364EB51A